MTSPIQPLPPDHLILSPEFLREHGAVKGMLTKLTFCLQDWSRSVYLPGSRMAELDIDGNDYCAPRSVVAAIDPEYVREWDKMMVLKRLKDCPKCTCADWGMMGHTSDCAVALWEKSQASERTTEVPADSQAPSLTAGPSSGVTVSPEGGELLEACRLAQFALRKLKPVRDQILSATATTVAYDDAVKALDAVLGNTMQQEAGQ